MTPLTWREEDLLRILADAVASGRGRLDSSDPRSVAEDQKRFRRVLLAALRRDQRMRQTALRRPATRPEGT